MKYLIILPLLLTASSSLLAQSRPDPIVAAPNAVPLRLMWQDNKHAYKFGYGFGGVGDINGDGIADFAIGGVVPGDSMVWNIYYGGRPKPSDTPAAVITFPQATEQFVVAGDFWGTGHKAIAFALATNDSKYKVYVFRTDSGHVQKPPYVFQTDEFLFLVSMTVADLDGDGTDELIITGQNNGVWYEKIYIYKGGPDFLQPTAKVLKLTDTTLPCVGDRAGILQAADINHDGKLDLLIGIDKGPHGDRHFLQIYLGSPGSPWNWTATPDRLYEMDGLANIGAPRAALDANGDGRLDFARPIPDGPNRGMYLFLTPKDLPPSGSTWLMLQNANTAFTGSGWPMNGGYLNDSLRRYAMLIADYPLYGFSGSPGGADTKYETYHTTAIGLNPALGDFNGDNRDDILNGNQIYAGGPYIPADFYRSGVEDVAVTGESPGALEVWPQPMKDELRIAWRKDMKCLPGKFQVHDAAGKLVARGEIEPGAGGAVWHCGAGIAAGVYVLSAYDQHGALLAAKKIVKGN